MSDGQQKNFYINPDQFSPQTSTPDIGLHQVFHHMPPHHSQQPVHQNIGDVNMQHPMQAQLNKNKSEMKYSVLPVGHGNFLKVYHHCPENLNDVNSNPPMQPQTQLNMNHHSPTQFFENYELFSMPSLMPIHMQNQFSEDLRIQDQHSRMVPDLCLQVPMVNNPIGNNNQQTTVEELTPHSTNQTTNMIINKLVSNWSPSGVYTQFGAPLPTQIPTDLVAKPQQTEVQFDCANNNDDVLPTANPSPILNNSLPTANLTNFSKMPVTENIQTEASVNTVNAFAPQEVKKRIVAEVKPMRMTYSDVLSKVNNVQSPKPQSFDGGKQFGQTFRTNHSNSFRRSMPEETTNSNSVRGSNKKSPTHENKENVSSTGKQNKRPNTTNPGKPQQQHQKSNNDKKQSVSGEPSQNNGNSNSKKRANKRESNGGSIDTSKNVKSVPTEKDSNVFYNVTAKRNVNSDGNSKATTTNGFVNSKSHKQNTRASSSLSNMNSNSATNSSTSNQNRFTRYTNNSGSVSNSYSYSSKRNRNGLNFGTNSTSNHNYELAKKILHTWLQFMLKILTWLYYLIYDIVVLGFSMVYDRLSHATVVGFAYAKQLHREIKQNSNKPGVWIRNACRRFDARFKKNSKFAFWRHFVFKKKPPEQVPESFKQGRLPQTGEEAMYSLLNCKGKDAYSILGVPPDSSQEQIRKHYKKIAVLVHPDKNKQAGAEEAFKVLQRAFELVGEPEKRSAYDQSLAEALHAEKAWSELHDLLSQLQTKITEAASTIRCSTCGLRHPRRLVDRRPYAARECATCKIRHSAREGDIWAETSFMGLRWKYLALMEGKVYDITEWANCQKDALSHLEPNSHLVTYRIVRGAQQQQQQQQQSHQHSPHRQFGNGMFKHDFPTSEASLHDFLDNLYSGQNPNNSNTNSSTRRRNRRN